MRVGSDDSFFFLNVRVRAPDEAQHGHRAAFGLLVDDVEDFDQRALAGGAKEHYGPMNPDGMPLHSRFEDPVGNRVVLWQA